MIEKDAGLVHDASGAIAQHIIEFLKDDENVALTLFARDINRLKEQVPNATIIKGDVLNKEDSGVYGDQPSFIEFNI